MTDKHVQDEVTQRRFASADSTAVGHFSKSVPSIILRDTPHLAIVFPDIWMYDAATNLRIHTTDIG
jgi:hypothetical protein